MAKCQDDRIWSLHCRHVPASEIDERLGLPEGTAREAIVRAWAENRQKDREGRNARP